MEEKIIQIVAKQLRIDPSEIDLNTDIVEDIGADSLDLVEILMAIEEEYDISVPDEEVVNFKTIRDLVEYVESNIV